MSNIEQGIFQYSMMKLPPTSSFLVQHSIFNIRYQRLSLQLYGSENPYCIPFLSPRLLDIYDITNSVVVVIDVFRATSTIATALYNGASRVIPVDSVELCMQLGKTTGGITAGERDGKVIPGPCLR